MTREARITANEIRRGLADCRRLLREAEQAVAAADGPAVYRALERLQHAAFDTRALTQRSGPERYVPQAER